MHSAAIKVLSLPYKLLFAAAVDDEVPLLRRVCFPAETSANLRHTVECAVGKRAFSREIRLKPVQDDPVGIVCVGCAVVHADGEQRVLANHVIADEIYCNLVYDNNEFVSFASLSEDAKNRTILVNGVSKSYAMTGWRIGYSASNPQLAKVMANYLSHSTSAPSTISQHAAITALTGPQEDMQVMKEAFEKRRDHLVERMNRIEGVSCIKPEGAFYVMMNMTGFIGKTMYGKVIESAEDFSQLFLEKGLVATVPCTAFAAPGFVRWSYATSLTEIDKGLDRLEEFIKNA